MKATYRAMQITGPGELELVERPTPTPGAGEVLIAVEACGTCDAGLQCADRPTATHRGHATGARHGCLPTDAVG